MTALDYFVLIILAASVALGATRGLVRGLFALLATLLGLVAATYAYPYAGKLLTGVVETPRAANLLGFVTVFVAVLIAGAMASRWLRGGLKRAHMTWLDTALGAGFGLLRGWLICSVIYLALTAFPWRLEAVERASFAPFLLEGTRVVAYLTSPELRERFSNGYEIVQRLWSETQ